jgi:hypothetical protein
VQSHQPFVATPPTAEIISEVSSDHQEFTIEQQTALRRPQQAIDITTLIRLRQSVEMSAQPEVETESEEVLDVGLRACYPASSFKQAVQACNRDVESPRVVISNSVLKPIDSVLPSPLLRQSTRLDATFLMSSINC